MKYYVYGLYKKNIEYKKKSIDEHLFYIGITSDKNLYFREKNHRRESNIHKINIINKYDFILRIFWVVDTKEESEEREEFLIRWFGKICDGGILTNYLDSAWDTKYIRKFQTSESARKISRALKEKNKNIDYRKLNRDRNLTVPYEKIIFLIEEWAKNPLESQQNFANRHGIPRSKFKDWLRLYKPEYIGLTKKFHQKIFDEIINKENKRPKDIIEEYSKKSGLSYEKSKGIYYKLINKK
jgi:hypothetical protein